MMKVILALLLVVGFACSGCGKEEPKPAEKLGETIGKVAEEKKAEAEEKAAEAKEEAEKKAE